jgi:hypothetical protein
VFAMWRPPDAWSYSYLLGIYLGDGWLGRSKPRANPYLAVSLDAAYPDVVDEVVCAIGITTMAHRPVTMRRHPASNCVIVRAASPFWLEAFPQHGPGKKHERAIRLMPWQREILDRQPEQFLRGLIHSDGCRTVNRFKTRLPSGRVAEYEYVRYFFSNLSEDIRGLFCEYCEKLGIRWTQSNPRNISVAHRDSVARLESFVGSKS